MKVKILNQSASPSNAPLALKITFPELNKLPHCQGSTATQHISLAFLGDEFNSIKHGFRYVVRIAPALVRISRQKIGFISTGSGKHEMTGFSLEEILPQGILKKTFSQKLQ